MLTPSFIFDESFLSPKHVAVGRIGCAECRGVVSSTIAGLNVALWRVDVLVTWIRWRQKKPQNRRESDTIPDLVPPLATRPSSTTAGDDNDSTSPCSRLLFTPFSQTSAFPSWRRGDPPFASRLVCSPSELPPSPALSQARSAAMPLPWCPAQRQTTRLPVRPNKPARISKIPTWYAIPWKTCRGANPSNPMRRSGAEEPKCLCTTTLEHTHRGFPKPVPNANHMVHRMATTQTPPSPRLYQSNASTEIPTPTGGTSRSAATTASPSTRTTTFWASSPRKTTRTSRLARALYSGYACKIIISRDHLIDM